MNCAEFQKVLPYIIETGGNAEEEAHLQSCPVCSDLVADLKYIADQAKLLVPMEDPAPHVWSSIQKSLEQEGLVRPAGARRGLLGLPWLAGALALLLIAAAAFLYREAGARPKENPEMAQVASSAQATAVEDEQVLAEVSARKPALKAAYADNLKYVNAYISDAQRSVEQDPDDQDARQSLIRAYEQKTLLYDMALSGPLQ